MGSFTPFQRFSFFSNPRILSCFLTLALLLANLFCLVNPASASTWNNYVIDGSSDDWLTDEFAGNSGFSGGNAYITWSSTCIYVGLRSGADSSGVRDVFVYISTSPAGGTAQAIMWNPVESSSHTLSFPMHYCFVCGSPSQKYLYRYNVDASSWGAVPFNGQASTSTLDGGSGAIYEFSIPVSDLNISTSNPVKILVFTQLKSGNQIYESFPAENNTGGSNYTFRYFYRIDNLGSGFSPVNLPHNWRIYDFSVDNDFPGSHSGSSIVNFTPDNNMLNDRVYFDFKSAVSGNYQFIIDTNKDGIFDSNVDYIASTYWQYLNQDSLVEVQWEGAKTYSSYGNQSFICVENNTTYYAQIIVQDFSGNITVSTNVAVPIIGANSVFGAWPLSGYVSGQVTAASTGCAGASIMASQNQYSSYNGRYGIADSSGNYAVYGLSNGPYYVTASSTPWASGMLSNVSVSGTGGTANQNINLVWGARITGTATSFISGLPLSNVSIRYNQWINNGVSENTYTDNNGNFTDQVNPSMCSISVSKSGYGTLDNITSIIEGTTNQFNFVMAPGGSVKGVVRYKGIEANNCEISIYKSMSDFYDGNSSNRTMTPSSLYEYGIYCSTGTYMFTNLVAGSYIISVSTAAAAKEYHTNISVYEGMETNSQSEPKVDFNLSDGAVITGLVKKQDGSPIYQAEVSLCWASNGNSYIRTQTVGDGSYQLPAVSTSVSAYFITVSKDGFIPAVINPYPVLSTGTISQNFTLNQATGIISGQLINNTSLTGNFYIIAEASGTFFSGSSQMPDYYTTVNSTGPYFLPVSPAIGVYDVWAYMDNIMQIVADAINVSSGSTTCNLIISTSPATISGNVYSNNTGAPLTNCIIEAWSGGHIYGWIPRGSGAFSFSYLPSSPGTYELRAKLSGYTTGYLYNVSTGTSGNNIYLAVDASQDTKKPIISHNYPAIDSKILGNSVTIQATVSDNGGTGISSGSIKLIVDSVQVSHSYSSSTGVVSYYQAGLGESQHSVYIECRDFALPVPLVNNLTWYVTVDTTPPTVSLTAFDTDGNGDMNFSPGNGPPEDTLRIQINTSENGDYTLYLDSNNNGSYDSGLDVFLRNTGGWPDYTDYNRSITTGAATTIDWTGSIYNQNGYSLGNIWNNGDKSYVIRLQIDDTYHTGSSADGNVVTSSITVRVTTGTIQNYIDIPQDNGSVYGSTVSITYRLGENCYSIGSYNTVLTVGSSNYILASSVDLTSGTHTKNFYLPDAGIYSDMTYGLFAYLASYNLGGVWRIWDLPSRADNIWVYIPPAAVTNLSALPGDAGGIIKLTWSAPGDDEWLNSLPFGSAYRIQYSSYSVLWGTGSAQVEISTDTVDPGTAQVFNITGLPTNTTYFFRLWTKDENAANWSQLSNSATACVSGDSTPPGPVTDLNASTGSYVGAVNLTWSAPGNDGYFGDLANGSEFRVFYSTSAGVAASSNYTQAQVTISTGNVSPGSLRTYNVAGLDPGTTYYFRIWTKDEMPANWSPLSNAATSWATLPAPGTDTFASQPGGGWLTTFNNSSNGNDYGRAVAKDNSGNVYIAGYSHDGLPGGGDIIVRKYNPAGTVLWTKYYSSPANNDDYGYGVAVDGSGNVYVTGYEFRNDIGQGNNLWVRKYNTNGLIQWTTTYNSPDNNNDEGYGIAVDNSGSVYVTGAEWRSGQNYNIWVRKYDTNGLIQWTTTYNSPDNNNDMGYGIAVDNSGNAYVTGTEWRTGQSNNIWVRKYDTNGLIQWTTTYNSSAYGDDAGNSIAVDGSGNVYVTGYSSETAGGENIWVRKYDTNGLIQWTTTYSSPGNSFDSGNSIAADESGNVYVSGSEARYDLGQGYNIWVRKYDTNGLVQWTTTYNSPDNIDDYGFGIAINNSGNVYATGTENRPGEGANIWLRKYVQTYPDAAPAGLTLINRATDTIQWGWTDNATNETGYRVKLATVTYNPTTDSLSGNLSANVTWWTDANLTPNTSHQVYVEAFTFWGTTVPTSVLNAFTFANPPIGTYLNNVTSFSITLNWSANTNPAYTKWGVLRSSDNFVSTNTLTNFGSNYTNTSYADNVPLPTDDIIYQYKVQAFNEEGVGTSYDVTVSTKLIDVIPPGPIADLNASTGTYVGAVNLVWTSPGDNGSSGVLTSGSQYRIFYSTDSGVATSSDYTQAQVIISTSGVSPGSLQSYNVGGLDPGTTYYFRIWTKDETPSNWSPLSNAATSWATLPAPGTDTGPTAQSDGGWMTTFNDASNLGDIGQSVAKDISGNVYITGYFSNGANNDIIVRKYNSAGTIQWTKYCNGSANFADAGNGIATDSSGNVYVTGGISETIGGNNIWVRKYDTNGSVQWTTTYNGSANLNDYGQGIATDSSGNVYVTGYVSETVGGDNIWVRKYDTNGLVLWTTTYNSPDNSDDYGRGIAVDNTGNVYVTGSEFRTGQMENIWVRKYDTNGLIQWTTTYNSPNNNIDSGNGIVADNTGNVYVVAYSSQGASGLDIWLRKYNTNGLVLWTTTYNSPANNEDTGYGIATDISGSVYVTGCEYRSDLGQSGNVWVRKYDTNGLVIWTTTYNNPANGWDEGWGITTDGSGNVYVTGLEFRSDLGQNANIWLRKYVQTYPDAAPAGLNVISCSTGTIQWGWNDNSTNESGYRVKRNGDASNLSGDLPANTTWWTYANLTPNTSHQVYVEAFTFWGTTVPTSVLNAFTFANPPSGTYFNNVTSFSITFNWSANTNPSYTKWGVLRSSDNFVSTNTLTNFGSNYTSTSYADNVPVPTDDIIYQYKVQAFNEEGVATSYDVTVSTHLIDVIPPAYVMDLTASLGPIVGAVKLIWTSPGDNGSSGVLTSGSQYRVFYSTDSGVAASSDYTQAQVIISTSGVSPAALQSYNVGGLDPGTTYYFRIWTKDETPSNWSPLSNAATSWATLPAPGTDTGPTAQSDGGWLTTYNSAINESDIGRSVAKDNSGNVYIVGYSSNASSSYDIIVRKYNSAGTVLWTKYYNSPANSSDYGYGVAVDGTGNVYVTGSEQRDDFGQNNNIWVRKYDTNGLIKWTTTYNGPANNDDVGYGIATDAGGNVYVTGDTYETAGGYNIWVRKYDTNGLIQWTTTYNGPANGYDKGYGIATDTSGNVYVTGYSNETVGDNNIWVGKYDTNGLVQWTTTYTSPGNMDDYGYGITTDAGGNVFVTGYTYEANNIWMRKYNTNGLVQWTTVYNGSANSFDYGRGVATDGSGNVYVTGNSNETVGGDNIWVRKYDTNGLIQWTTTYNGSANSDDVGYGIATDTSGDVYVTGYSNETVGGYNIWLRKYVQTYPDAMPAGLNVINRTTDTIQWGWTDNAANETGYRVKLATVTYNPATDSLSGNLSANVTWWTDANLTPNTSHQVYVEAFTFWGSSRSVSSISTYTYANQPSGTAFSAIYYSSVTVSWNANNNPSYTLFELKKSTDGSLFNVLATSAIVSYNDAGLLENVSYYYKVRAKNEDNFWTQYDVTVSTTIMSAPADILDLTALAGNSDGDVTLNWTSPGDDGFINNLNGTFLIKCATYFITTGDFDTLTASSAYRFVFSISTSNLSPKTAVSTAIIGLNPGTTYYFAIEVCDKVNNWSVWRGTSTIFNTASFVAAKDALPGQPQSPQVNPASKTSIDIIWTSPATPPNVIDYDKYAIYRATYVFASRYEPDVLWISSPVWTSGTTNFTDSSGLSDAATYYYSIILLDKGDEPNGLFSMVNESAYSAIVSTRPQSSRPSAPSNLSAAKIFITSITWSWTDTSSSEDGFFLKFATSPANPQFIVKVDTNVGSADETVLSTNTAYGRCVAAYNSYGESDLSNSATVYTLAVVPEAAGFTSVTANTINVNWLSNTNPSWTNYICEISTDNFSTVNTSSQTLNLSAVFYSLLPNSTYWFRVKARNEDKLDTTYSYFASTHTSAEIPGITSVTTVSTGSVVISFVDTNPAGTQYSVEASTGVNTAYGEIYSGNYIANVNHATLNPNVTYYYRIRARNLDNVWTSYNAERSTHTLASIPGAISFVSVSRSSITLQWADTNSAGTQYDVEASTTVNISYGLIYAGIWSNVSHLTLNPDTTYYYRVRAKNLDGIYTGYNTEASTRTKCYVPGALSFAGVYISSIQVSWVQTNQTWTTYELWTSTGANNAYGLTWTGTGTVAAHSGLNNDTTYYYKLKAKNLDSEYTDYNSETSTHTGVAVPGVTVYTIVSSNSIVLNWAQTNQPWTVYEGWVSSVVSTAYSIAWSSSGNSTAGPLDPDTTYYIKIRAKNIDGVYSDFNAETSTKSKCAVPGDLNEPGVWQSSITLSWVQTNQPWTTYELWCSTTVNTAYGVIWAGTGTGPVTNAGLNTDTTYYYKVRARNLDGEYTGYNTEKSTRTKAAIPGAITFGTVAGNSVAVNWSPGGNQPWTTYELWSSTTVSTAYGMIWTSTGTGPVTNAGLNTDTTYYYKVRAKNLDGEYTGYNTDSSTRTKAAVPGVITLGTVTDSSVAISWAQTNQAWTTYELWSSTIVNTAYGMIWTGTGTGPVTNAGLNTDTTYYYKVRARNLDGEYTGYNTEKSTCTKAVVPGAITFGTVAGNSVAVNWSPAGNQPWTTYELWASTTISDGYGTAPVWSGTGVNATHSGLNTDTTYYYKVRARNLDGEYTGYNADSSTRTKAAVPGAITFGSVLQSSVTLSWAQINQPWTIYELWSSTGNNVSYGLLWSGGWISSVAHEGLSINTTYYYKVRAKNLDGEYTGYNTELSTHTLAVVPGAISVTNVSTGSVVISWVDTNPAGTQYSVEASTGVNTSYGEIYNGNYVAGVNHAALNPNVTYYYRIRARNFDNVRTSYNTENSTHTLAVVPGAISVTNVSTGSIVISWVNTNPAGTQYSVEASTGVNTAYGEIYNGNYVAGVNHAALNPNVTYYYRVRARNIDDVWTSYNTERSTHTLAVVPGIISVTNVSTGSVVISWVDTNPAGTRYSVEASTGTNTSYGEIYNGNYVAGVNHATLNPNVTYYYRIRARNLDNVWTSYNSERSTHTLASIPGAINFVNVSRSSITVQWADTNSAGTQYEIEASTAVNTSYGLIYTGIWSNVSHLTLNPDTTYYYRVRAKNLDDIYTGYNTEASTRTKCYVPGALSFSGVYISSIQVFWVQTNQTWTIYELWCSTGNNVSYGLLRSGSWVSSVTQEGLSINTTYYYKVRANNLDGENTGYNAEMTTHTFVNSPINLAFTGVYFTSATIQWGNNSNPNWTVYEINASTDNFAVNFSTPVPFASKLTALTTTIALQPGATNYLRARAQNLDSVLSAEYSNIVSTYVIVTTRKWAAVSAGNASVVGNWSPPVLPLNGDTIIFDGSVSNQGCVWDLTGITLSSFTIMNNYAGTITAGVSFDINGDFSMSSGTFIAGNSTHTVAGDWKHTGGTFNPSAGTIRFDGGATVKQYISQPAAASFNNIIAAGQVDAGGNAITASTGLDISGNFTLLSGRFDANSQVIRLGGNLTQTGGTLITTGTFVTDGAFYQTLAPANPAFNNLRIENSSGVVITSAGQPHYVTGDFEITSGAKFDNSNKEIQVNGNFTSSGTFINTGSTVTFAGSSNTTVWTLVNISSFNSIVINKSGGASLNCLSDVYIRSKVDLTGGTWKLGSSTVTVNGTVTAGTGATLDMSGGSAILKPAISVAIAGGKFVSDSLSQTIMHPSGGNYTFTVTGGTVDINGLTLKSLDSNGLWFASTVSSTIVQNLNNVAFSNISAGATSLKFEQINQGSHTFNNIGFIDSNISTNITVPSIFTWSNGANYIKMTGAYGTKTGVDYESDVNSVIFWSSPTAFTSYTAEAKTNSSIEWRWSDVKDEVLYRVYSATGGVVSPAWPSLQYNTTYWLWTGLNPNTSYQTYIEAYNAIGVSTYPVAPLSRWTFANAPSGLSTISYSSFNATLTWGANSNPSGTVYRLRYSTDSGFGIYTDSALTGSTTQTISLSVDTTYYITAYVLNGEAIPTSQSNTVTLLTMPSVPQPPAVFYGIALSTSVMNLNWTLVNRATYYILYNETGNWLGNINTPTTYYTETGLFSNTLYTRTIKAGNETGISVTSTTANRYTLALPPSNISFDTAGSSTVYMSWPASGATVYRIERSSSAAGVWIFASSAATTSGSVGSLSPDTTYFFRIAGINGDNVLNESLYSGVASTITKPSPPAGCGAYATSTASFVWYWSTGTFTGSNIWGYRVYSSTSGKLSGDLAINTSFWAESGTGLSANTQYTRYARSFNATGESSNSLPVSRYTFANPPTGISISSTGVHGIGLSWNTNGAERFRIDYSTSSNYSSITTLDWSAGIAGSSYVITRLQPSTTYYFVVSGYNADHVVTVGSAAVSGVTLSITQEIISPSAPQTIIKTKTVNGVVLQIKVEFSAGAITKPSYLEISVDPLVIPVVIDKNKIDEANNKIAADLKKKVLNYMIIEFVMKDYATGALSTGTFSNTVKITLPYLDTNNDGYIDDTGPKFAESMLKIYTLNENTKEWDISGGLVDGVNNCVTAEVRHFSVFTLIGTLTAASDLSNVKVYPNPYKPGATGADARFDRAHGIRFDNLTEKIKIRIYNIAAELVYEYESNGTGGSVDWPAENTRQEKVASGVYIYYVTNPDDAKMTPAKGKLSVIR